MSDVETMIDAGVRVVLGEVWKCHGLAVTGSKTACL
jgi:hypothetical protein